MTRTPARIAALLVALTSACGGSSSSTPPPPPPGATAMALKGAITATATGSLTVNGTTVDTRAAEIRIEGRAGAEAELHRGMKVRVRGSRDRTTGETRATRVEFGDDLQGRSAADVAAGDDRLTVGGREVEIEDGTRITDDRGTDLGRGDLRRDDRLSVSGVVDDHGRLRASSIRRTAAQSADDSFEAKGYVVAIAADRASFDLAFTAGGPVAFHVTLASGTLAPAIAVGAFVEVHAPGAASGADVAGATVVLDDDGLGESGAEVEVEGIVTSGTSAAFVIDSQAVLTDGNTRWEFGAAGDLAPGVKVEAEGTLDAAGNLLAQKVSFRDSLRIQGITAGALAGGSGTVTVLGKVILFTSLTRMDDAYAEGQVFEIRGMPATSTPGVDLVATRATRTSSGGGGARPFVQAVVTAASAATEQLTVLGIDVSTAGASYRDHSEAAITRDAFYGALTAGKSVVKVRFDAAYAGGPGTADEAELEDDPAGHP